MIKFAIFEFIFAIRGPKLARIGIPEKLTPKGFRLRFGENAPKLPFLGQVANF